jgi:hypothetical protein
MALRSVRHSPRASASASNSPLLQLETNRRALTRENTRSTPAGAEVATA